LEALMSRWSFCTKHTSVYEVDEANAWKSQNKCKNIYTCKLTHIFKKNLTQQTFLTSLWN